MQDTSGTELEQLIARIARGDRDAFEKLYASFSARLYAFCISVLKDRPEAEDTLKNVFVRVWREGERWPSGNLSASTWLLTITRNAAIDRLRAREAALAEAGPGHPAPSRPASAAITPRTEPHGPALPIPGLTPEQSSLLRKVYLEGASLDDLARDAGLSEATARAALRQTLERFDDGAGENRPDRILAGELALGLLPEAEAETAVERLSADKAFAQDVRDWQERLAGLAGGLTPVLPPARARQRLREELGHGAPPLSVDPTDSAGGLGRFWIVLLILAALAGLIVYLQAP